VRARQNLVMFVKAPRLGAVKSRLAADIGAAAAWQFYRRAVRGVLTPLARDARWTCWLAVTPDRRWTDERFWPARCPRIDQGQGDLGARMWWAFRALPPGPAVIVGSDIPALAPRHVARAFRALGRAEAVFGPARDGGYWLVGLSRRARRADPFQDVAWSSEFALAQTMANLPQHVRVELLDTLEDVDDGASFARWRAGPGGSRRLNGASLWA
jgi:hypothetical protein